MGDRGRVDKLRGTWALWKLGELGAYFFVAKYREAISGPGLIAAKDFHLAGVI